MKNQFKIIFGSFTILVSMIVGFLVFQQKKTPDISLTQTKSITTSFYPFYFIAKKIVGNNLNIINLTPSGSEVHDYELTPANQKDIEDSKLLIYHGKLEPWGSKIKKSNSLITQLDPLETDPHIWLDPVYMRQITDSVFNKIVGIDFNNKTTYNNNHKDLVNQLEELDKNFSEGLKTCKTRKFYTGHPAFKLLARRYNLQMISLVEANDGGELNPIELARLIEEIKDTNIQYVLGQTNENIPIIDTIVKDLGINKLELNSIEVMTNDEINNGKNYISEMQANLANLRIALECQ